MKIKENRLTTLRKLNKQKKTLIIYFTFMKYFFKLDFGKKEYHSLLAFSNLKRDEKQINI
jgi:hypothetical protein